MSWIIHQPAEKISRGRILRSSLSICGILAALLVLIPAGSAWAQTPSTLDTLRILNVTNVHPGDTFNLDLYMRNVDTVSGFNIRIAFNRAVIEPLTDTTVSGVDTTVRMEVVQQLRGVGWNVFGGAIPTPGVATFAAIDFREPTDLPINPGGGATARMRWLVHSAASPQSVTIAFQNDPQNPQSYNTISDITGLILKRPVLTNGTVTITTSGGNNAPTITNCPAPLSVNQGQLAQFTVTAMDPDGDQLSLAASNMPAGATFSPANPATGTATVSGTFQWIPSTSQSGNFTVSFQATDSPGGLSSSFCNVTISVGTVSGNLAPVVICPSSSSFTVDQGQNVQFAISASDANGDPIQLYPVNAPSGATLLPSNPIVGTGSASGTFSWTPSMSQSGIFSIGFQAKDNSNALSSVCNVTVVVNQVQVDRLFSTSVAGDNPQGGVPGTVGVVLPVDLFNVQNSYGVQFDFVYDAAIFTPTAIQTSNRLAGFSVYENLGTTPGRIRVVTFSLTGSPVAAGTSTVLFNIVGRVNAGVLPGAYDVIFENAWESIDPDPAKPSVALATTNGVIMVDNLGDANVDTRIDVADVVAVIGYILGNFQFNQRQFGAANVTGDNLVDVFDLTAIINMIFGAPVTPVSSEPGGGTPAIITFHFNKNDGQYGAYYLSASVPVDVAGAQIEVAYDAASVGLGNPEPLGSASGLQLHYRDDGQGHLIALMVYDPSNSASRIPPGQSDVLRIPLNGPVTGTPAVTLRTVKLAATDAGRIEVAGFGSVPRSFELEQNYPNPFNPSTTIAFSLGDRNGGQPTAVRLDVLNVLGQRVTTLVEATLEPGRYEYVWDGTDQDHRPVASGLYFYRLSAGSASEAKKMVLMK